MAQVAWLGDHERGLAIVARRLREAACNQWTKQVVRVREPQLEQAGLRDGATQCGDRVW